MISCGPIRFGNIGFIVGKNRVEISANDLKEGKVSVTSRDGGLARVRDPEVQTIARKIAALITSKAGVTRKNRSQIKTYLQEMMRLSAFREAADDKYFGRYEEVLNREPEINNDRISSITFKSE